MSCSCEHIKEGRNAAMKTTGIEITRHMQIHNQ